MNGLAGVAVYFVLWWLCLFVVLPFGVKDRQEGEDITLGADRGAPHQPMLVKKAIATTILAGLLFGIFYLFFNVYNMTLEDLMPGL
jgi:predicted secreted protein